jgi:uncharacterized membrane protein YfcA
MPLLDVLLTVLILLMAVLYSSVGHAGSSGFQAAMALCETDPTIMRPAAQSMNVLVAAITFVNFARAGHFRFRLWWPFAAASVPAAFFAGVCKIPIPLFKPLLGVTLIFAAARFAWPMGREQPQDRFENVGSSLRLMLQLTMGLIIGVLSGLTGTGGGIFFTPLLLLLGWASPQEAAGVTAPFIVVTSLSALVGLIAAGTKLPSQLAWWMPAAVVGGMIGSTWGSRHLGGTTLKRLLSVVLAIAGAKLMFNV